MKRLLIIILVSVCYLTACNRAPDSATGSGSTSGGGSVHPVDSIKAVGSGVNGESSNTLGSTDTITPGHSSASPLSDTTKKKP